MQRDLRARTRPERAADAQLDRRALAGASAPGDRGWIDDARPDRCSSTRGERGIRQQPLEHERDVARAAGRRVVAGVADEEWTLAARERGGDAPLGISGRGAEPEPRARLPVLLREAA